MIKTMKVISLFVIGFILICGCLNDATPSPPPEKPVSNYIDCSKYHVITEHYKTPSYYYVGFRTPEYGENSHEIILVTKEVFEKTAIGDFWENPNVIRVNETESGFRDACIEKVR
jgi:hypothetical protein